MDADRDMPTNVNGADDVPECRPYAPDPQYRVWSDGRIETCKRRGTQAGKIGPWRLRKPRVLPHGYATIVFSRENVLTVRLVSHVILETFVGPCPPGMVAQYRDDDRTNFAVTNLYWGPNSRSGRRPKLTLADRAECRRLNAEGWTYREIGQRFGVTHTCAWYACHPVSERAPKVGRP